MFSFSLPPLENMAYLLAKKPELHFNYDEIMHEAHHRAFTVAKITRLDLLGDIQTSLLLAQKEGKSFEHWKNELKPKLQKKGWWGERDITNPKSGEVRRVNINSRRLQTIYDTNMRVSYAQGRARAQYALEGEIYLRYVAILDSRTRESHRRLHGTILPREHDFWKKNYPPNGWRCRCRVDAYTKDECKKRGWHIAENAQHIAETDWSYDTRGLDEDRELERIYLQKAKRIASLKAPSKLIQSYLKEDFREVLENRKRFSAIHTIFKQIKNSPTSDLLDRHIMPIALLTKEIKSDLQKVSDVPITAKEILLSGSTIRTHFHHENVGAFDYYLVAHFNKPYKRKSTKVAHILYFYKLGHYYKAVFKVTQDGKEVFLQSLVKGSRKP